VRLYSSEHDSETYEQFNERYVKFFEGVEDQFEAQRGLNNAFAHDLVPSGEVIEAALRAARRVNDYALATRVFEGIKFKVENQGQYKQYLEALAPVREELGISLKEELFVN
jgi:cytochrome c oxidase subunit 6, mitochondrial